MISKNGYDTMTLQIYDSLHILRAEMLHLASLLSEFPVVMSIQGAGPITGPQLMAEVGDLGSVDTK